MTVLDSLGVFVAQAPSLDGSDLRGARRAVLDTLAVATAGRNEKVTDAARLLVRETAATDGVVARDLTTGQARPTPDAAFVNGVAAHALDFDDVSMAMSGHPSTLLVPVALALGEATDATVDDILNAYCVGLRVDHAVSAGFDLFGHYNLGWHASVTVGTIGATATAARLLKLTPEQSRYAMGIAVSMASGTRQNFGTMTKPLHIGFAAQNALCAARLAALGVDSSAAALDGPLGFYALYGDRVAEGVDRMTRLASVTASLEGSAGDALACLSVKRYPCCYQTHRAIDAAIDVRAAAEVDFHSDDVLSAVVHLNPGSDTSLIHQYASTPTEARFCLRYAVAKALLDGEVVFTSFTDAAVQAAPVQSLMRRIEVRYSETTPYEQVDYALDYAAVELTLKSGAVHRVTCAAPRGNAERPLTDDELTAKADTCLLHAGVKPGGTRILAGLEDGNAPVSVLIDTLIELSEKG